MTKDILYEKEMREFNLNDVVLVKLKPDGFIHYHKKYNEHLPSRLRKSLKEIRLTANEDGYVKFMFWEFMQMFGETIAFGYSPIFETTILIKES
jgi:hypothetical protein